MQIVRYMTRDPEGNQVDSAQAFVLHGRTAYNGAHIIENPENGTMLAVSAPVSVVISDISAASEQELALLFSPSARASIREAANR